MNELYEAIEMKIKEAGFDRKIDGRDVYYDICVQIEDKEPGTYLVMSKFFDDVVFEYTVTVMEEEFNLSTLRIVQGEKVIEIDFDK